MGVTKGFVAVMVLVATTATGAVFDVRDYGAKGDGVSKDTASIQKAIDAALTAGGGRVLLQRGTFLSGPIRLESGIDLHIDGTASLLASSNIADFKEWSGVKCLADSSRLPRGRNASFILADGAERISISGDGVIDCNGGHHVVEKKGNWSGLRYERKYPASKSLPRVVLFAGCRDVKITDITLANPPGGWGFWINDCDRVQVRGAKILANVEYPNNDGLHFNCCRDVTVSDCIIESGDDSIVVRADCTSLPREKPCERVVVANCTLRSWANAIRVGWEGDGIVRDCSFSNISIHDTSTGICIMLPAAPPGSRENFKGTLVENILFDGIRMSGIYAHPIRAVIDKSTGTKVMDIRDVRFSNVHATGLELPLISGRPGNPLRRFTFSNCSFCKITDEAQPGWRRHGPAVWERVRQTTFENIEGFVFDNTTFNAESVLPKQENPFEPVSRMENRTGDPIREPGIFGDYWWANRFLSRSRLVEGFKGKTVDIVMIGDSIMHFWEWKHPESWAKFTKGRTVLNLGYGGDKTQNVLWRMEHGELDGYTARCVVLMIGTNNNASNDSDPVATAEGVKALVRVIRERQPNAKIILHPIFPRGEGSDPGVAGVRKRNARTSAILEKFANESKHVTWINFNDKLVGSDGWVPKRIMADGLHPTAEGYNIWAKALEDELGAAGVGN